MTAADHAQLAALPTFAERDAFLRSAHVRHHDRPLAHIGVHVAWLRTHLAAGNYLRVLGHAFAGFVVAGPASLLQRTTGISAFKAR